MYEEENACWNCSVPRKAPSPVEPAASEHPVYIRRFVNEPKATPKTQSTNHHGHESLEQHTFSSVSDPEVEVTCPKLLFQASAEAQRAFRAKKRIIDALENFMQLWTSDAGNLNAQDRASIIGKAQKYLAGCIPSELFWYYRLTDIYQTRLR